MPPTCEYHRPVDIRDACRLLTELEGAQPLAGGTDLLFDIETGLRQARHLISLQRIEELKLIRDETRHVSVGAGCTAREVQSSPLMLKFFPEVVKMAVVFASPQVRARATLAGNICSAVPCGDFPVILIALGAEIELRSARGTRVVGLDKFFAGPRQTVREQDELLTRILIPKKPPGSAAAYLKFRRRASNSLALASSAAYLGVGDGVCRDARIVLGAVAPVPLLATRAGASLVGQPLTPDTIATAAELAQNEACPISDVRGSEQYRRELVYVLTQRVLKTVAEDIDSETEGFAEHES
jgi:carbon-monoxide dehydrogenase medium subunit